MALYKKKHFLFRFQDIKTGYGRLFSAANFASGLSFLGFSLFAKHIGLHLHEVILFIVIIWALPAQMLSLTLYMQGVPILAVLVAASMTSIRLLFMTIDILPRLRVHGYHRITDYLLAHCVSITTWLEYQRLESHMTKRNQRAGFFLGLGIGQISYMIIVAVIAYTQSSHISKTMITSLTIIPAIFFYVALFSRSHTKTDYLAIAIPTFLLPILYVVLPQFDILLSALIGGTIVWIIDYYIRKTSPSHIK